MTATVAAAITARSTTSVEPATSSAVKAAGTCVAMELAVTAAEVGAGRG